MKLIYLIWGAILAGIVFIGAFSYGAYKFIEEPEFGIFTLIVAITWGGSIAIGIIVLSIVVADVSERIHTRKVQGEQAAPSNR